MTDTVDSLPAGDEIDAFLALIEAAWPDDTVRVDAEFYAIIAANWDIEPPEPPGPPAGLPARWTRPDRTLRPGSGRPPADQEIAGHHHRRQRSPPSR